MRAPLPRPDIFLQPLPRESGYDAGERDVGVLQAGAVRLDELKGGVREGAGDGDGIATID